MKGHGAPGATLCVCVCVSVIPEKAEGLQG